MTQKLLDTVKAIRVMRKIDHKPEILKFKNVHAARRLRGRRNKGLQRGLYILSLVAYSDLFASRMQGCFLIKSQSSKIAFSSMY